MNVMQVISDRIRSLRTSRVPMSQDTRVAQTLLVQMKTLDVSQARVERARDAVEAEVGRHERKLANLQQQLSEARDAHQALQAQVEGVGVDLHIKAGPQPSE